MAATYIYEDVSMWYTVSKTVIFPRNATGECTFFRVYK